MRFRFNEAFVRENILSQVMDGYGMPEGWSKIAALKGLAMSTRPNLRAMYHTASNRAVGGRGFNEVLPIGPAANAKAWQIARHLGS